MTAGQPRNRPARIVGPQLARRGAWKSRRDRS